MVGKPGYPDWAMGIGNGQIRHRGTNLGGDFDNKGLKQLQHFIDNVAFYGIIGQ
jgi:hypothetical protein